MTILHLTDPKLAEDTATKRQPVVKTLLRSTKTQRHTWIDNNVTDLASAKEFMKKLLDLVIMLERRDNG